MAIMDLHAHEYASFKLEVVLDYAAFVSLMDFLFV